MRVIPVVIIGKGNVGRAFIRQVAETHEAFLRRGVDLRVTGIVGRTTAVYIPQGIPVFDLNAIAEGRARFELRPAGAAGGGWDDVTASVAGMDAEEQVIVDMTTEKNHEAHAAWLRRGWHVITANKKPLTSSLIHYDAIMAAQAEPGGPAYRYEATVGAGLPVVSTLHEMLFSGDTVIEVRAAMSGTLGHLFAECGKGVPFALAVRDAKTRGYTEPDPREDLSGVDVSRKALILARLLGHRIELEDIAAESLVPEALRDAKAEEFLDGLAEHSREFDERVKSAAHRGHALRYLATLTPDSVRVGIEEVPTSAGFGLLEGPENMFVIRSRRYNALPLVIKGPGAGAEVSAAGTFADLLRICRL
jgi:homoserine dehydrogenase